MVHVEVEDLIYGKTDWGVDALFKAINKNIWFVWLLEALEGLAMIEYFYHYREDRTFRLNHLLSFVTIIFILFLTDENWDIISNNYILLPFSDISKIISFLGIVVIMVPYACNERDDYKKIPPASNILDKKRERYAQTIINGLMSVDNVSGSYAIGICGGWGSGKTTFLMEVDKLLRLNKCDIHWFNAWDCSSVQNINSDFFAMLRNAIKPYCSSLEKSLVDYETALDDSGIPSFLNKLFVKFAGLNNDSIYELKNQIRDTLQKTHHDIYIIIDDLDRMESGEILEVLKLIRNNANFPHLKFIVAYDKEYVTNQIREITKKDGYLNKIFMAEYFLPKLTGVGSKFDIFTKTLKNIDENSKSLLFDYIKKDDRQIIDAAIGSLRQAEILARQFEINYKFVSAGDDHFNFHIYDFFWLELLKITDRSTYDLMDNQPDMLFKVNENSNGATYYSWIEKEKLMKIQIPESSKNIIQKLLFDGKKVQSIKRMMYVENYPNYFAMGLEAGKLHRGEFNKLIKGYSDNDTILLKIYGWINNHQYESLLNHILIIPLKSLDTDQAKNLVMSAIAFCFRVNGMDYYINKLVDNCFNLSSYRKDIKNEIEVYVSHTMRSYIECNDHHLSIAKMLVRMIKNKKQDEKSMLINYYYCQYLLQKNFRSYVARENPDASEIFDQNKMLHKIVKASCRNYTVYRDNEYDEDINYHVQYIKDDILDWFSKHKSNNINCIEDYKNKFAFEYYDGYGYEYDFNHEEYENEIESLFGSFELFNDFKMNCFE